MDFRQFRYFVTTAEELHFARAAERLGIAQPALSQQIKVLENQLGARLFYRAKRRIELTDTGAAFLEEARATLERAEKAVRVARDTARGEAGSIDIGIVGSVMYEPRFPHLLKNYRKAHPNVQLSLHEMPILAQIEAVQSQHLDIGIIREPIPPGMPEELELFTLSTQRLVAVLPLDHRLAIQDSVELAQLADDPFLAFLDPSGVGMGQALLDLCRHAGFEPKITQKVAEIATLISLVAAGFGVSLVADIVRHLQLPGVCYLPLADIEARSNLIVVQRRFERSATVRGLLEEIRGASPSSSPD
ncbi:LysR substrate-binding domain-containing protein [Propionivibrio limicola]|uniref:LysR substrate-binding domain-containing protein n=1 Tax=Propionivibrio limicola TaxID=167645 RepID=UPI001290EAAF|nr:LysR substrate-binding domain-containing protein [Propionivibrio limicola]